MDDLISRNEAIEALGERPIVWTDDDQYTLGQRNQYDIDRLAIGTLPPAQQWIPVSEGLPGYGEDVLLSIGGVCIVGHCAPTNGYGVDWYYDGWYHPENDVDAWMPLPEPWKGEG